MTVICHPGFPGDEWIIFLKLLDYFPAANDIIVMLIIEHQGLAGRNGALRFIKTKDQFIRAGLFNGCTRGGLTIAYFGHHAQGGLQFIKRNEMNIGGFYATGEKRRIIPQRYGIVLFGFRST